MKKQETSTKTKVPVKHSIRTKLVLATICMVFMIIAGGVCLNLMFMEKYYTDHKGDSLKQVMHLLENINFTALKQAMTESTDPEEMPDDEFSEQLKQYCESNNLLYLVMDADQTVVSTNQKEREASKIGGRLFGYNAGIDKAKPEIIEQTSSYTLQKNSDFFSKEMYMELWGQLQSGYSFIIRTPVASIKESASLANSFYLIIGVCMAVFWGIIAGLWVRRFTRPVQELTELSERMSDLDFEARYTSGGKDEIGVLGKNFNRMSDQLEKTISELKSVNLQLEKDIQKKEEIDEMRKEFLSNVSHELKTPIALIQGYAEGLIDNVNDDPESRAFYADVIVDEARKMNEMVKKLLSLNHLEFGNDPVEMECFDLTALIRGVLQSSGLLIEQKGVTVKLHQQEPLYVWGDEFRVEEVITNYISNALNHIDGDKILDIRCKVENGIVRTSVFNTGQQIPKEDIDKIWIKFYKVDKARTREYGGSGIGLSIVKAIMDSMRQQCGVENYANGVEFWFTLEHREHPEE